LRESVIDLFLPRRCVVCGTAGSWLCSTCAEDLQVLDERACSRCGCPGAVAAACPECRDRDLAFGRAAAAFAYAGPARRLVGACKFRALRSLTSAMADLATPRFRVFVASLPAAPSAAAQLAEAPGRAPVALPVAGTAAVVTCVPPHRDHQFARGFNQAELLARELARAAGLPFARLLARERETGSQHDLGRAARAANARGAFTLLPGVVQASEKLKRVVIVDDVYTTGETLNSCATVLVNAGFEPFAFTFARTVRASFRVSRSAAPAQLIASRRAGASTAS
jgi:predicted amidophosphoribosyltransferase